MTPPLRRGDIVQITIGGWSVEAFVSLASANGRSVIVLFDGLAPLADAQLFAPGMLPLYEDEGGAWCAVAPGHTLVEVERVHA